MLKHLRLVLALYLTTLAPLRLHAITPGEPIRVAIVGLVHGHVKGFLAALPKNSSAHLVAIVEPDRALAEQYAAKYHLDSKLFYTDTERMIAEVHPDAVLVYTTIRDHRKVIEMAARHGVSSMVEKPLSTTLEDAIAIRAAAREHHVQVLVNYETTWYSSNDEALREADGDKLGGIRKVIVHDGHEGPKEIGVGPEWLPWLTDPAQNGAGALFDFGCYGADLLTVMMHGGCAAECDGGRPDGQARHLSACRRRCHSDPPIPKGARCVDAVVGLEFLRKDMEIYGDGGYAVTVGPAHLQVRYHGDER